MDGMNGMNSCLKIEKWLKAVRPTEYRVTSRTLNRAFCFFFTHAAAIFFFLFFSSCLTTILNPVGYDRHRHLYFYIENIARLFAHQLFISALSYCV